MPLQFYTYSIVNHIASTLGEIIETDFNLDLTANWDYARVRINWPLSNPLIVHRRFRFGPHNGVLITFRYEKLRNYCFCCQSLCHEVIKCEDTEQEYQMNPPRDDIENNHSPTLEVKRMNHQATFQIQPSRCPAIEDSPSCLMLEPPRQSGKSVTDFISLNGHKISSDILQTVYDSYSKLLASEASTRLNNLVQSDPKDKGKAEISGNNMDALLSVEAMHYHSAKRKRIAHDTFVGESSNSNDLNRGTAGPIPLPSQ